MTITQSRVGAIHVLNAGLFAAIRGSGIFLADPDLGLGNPSPLVHVSRYAPTDSNPPDIDNAHALQRYHELLLAILRVITSVVLSRGAQNEQTIQKARAFLLENRSSMVGVFKRQGKIGIHGATTTDNDTSIDELVEIYVLLISLTGFVEVSDLWDSLGGLIDSDWSANDVGKLV